MCVFLQRLWPYSVVGGASALVLCTTVPATCMCISLNVMWGVDAPML